jgi:hypothetical protein
MKEQVEERERNPIQSDPSVSENSRQDVERKEKAVPGS